jgi:hypothetical protein
MAARHHFLDHSPRAIALLRHRRWWGSRAHGEIVPARPKTWPPIVPALAPPPSHGCLKNLTLAPPAMAAGVADHIWSLREIAALLH